MKKIFLTLLFIIHCSLFIAYGQTTKRGNELNTPTITTPLLYYCPAKTTCYIQDSSYWVVLDTACTPSMTLLTTKHHRVPPAINKNCGKYMIDTIESCNDLVVFNDSTHLRSNLRVSGVSKYEQPLYFRFLGGTANAFSGAINYSTEALINSCGYPAQTWLTLGSNKGLKLTSSERMRIYSGYALQIASDTVNLCGDLNVAGSITNNGTAVILANDTGLVRTTTNQDVFGVKNFKDNLLYGQPDNGLSWDKANNGIINGFWNKDSTKSCYIFGNQDSSKTDKNLIIGNLNKIGESTCGGRNFILGNTNNISENDNYCFGYLNNLKRGTGECYVFGGENKSKYPYSWLFGYKLVDILPNIQSGSYNVRRFYLGAYNDTTITDNTFFALANGTPNNRRYAFKVSFGTDTTSYPYGTATDNRFPQFAFNQNYFGKKMITINGTTEQKDTLFYNKKIPAVSGDSVLVIENNIIKYKLNNNPNGAYYYGNVFGDGSKLPIDSINRFGNCTLAPYNIVTSNYGTNKDSLFVTFDALNITHTKGDTFIFHKNGKYEIELNLNIDFDNANNITDNIYINTNIYSFLLNNSIPQISTEQVKYENWGYFNDNAGDANGVLPVAKIPNSIYMKQFYEANAGEKIIFVMQVIRGIADAKMYFHSGSIKITQITDVTTAKILKQDTIINTDSLTANVITTNNLTVNNNFKSCKTQTDTIEASNCSLNNPIYIKSPVTNMTNDTLTFNDGTKNYTWSVPYGSMYVDDGTQTIAITATETIYTLTASLSDGGSSGMTFQNAHELKCLRAGKYQVNWSATIKSSTDFTQEAMIVVNSTEQSKTANAVRTKENGTEYNLSGTGILTLAADDLIKLGFESELGTGTITVTHANISIVRVGDFANLH